MPHPLILTAMLGDADFVWVDALRRAHFPVERNRVPAHITLFHHLPPSLENEVLDRMKALTTGPAPWASLSSVLRLGNGVAFRVESSDLLAMRQELADAFHGLLTPQDQPRPRLHITIQNKVSAADSRALAEALQAEFRARPLAIAGLALWRYLDGPWEAVRQVSFRG